MAQSLKLLKVMVFEIDRNFQLILVILSLWIYEFSAYSSNKLISQSEPLRYSLRPGPNCWNLALVNAGLLPALRFSSPQEFKFFVDSPLCRRLQANEMIQRGDIGAIRTHGHMNEVHGFSFIDDNIVISKADMRRETPFEQTTLNAVLDQFDVPQSEICRSRNESHFQKCEKYLKIFRCSSHFAKRFNEISSEHNTISHSLKSIQDFEVLLEAYLMSGISIEVHQLRDFQNALAVLIETRTTLASERFIYELIYHRLSSIRSQLSQLNEMHGLRENVFRVTIHFEDVFGF